MQIKFTEREMGAKALCRKGSTPPPKVWRLFKFAVVCAALCGNLFSGMSAYSAEEISTFDQLKESSSYGADTQIMKDIEYTSPAVVQFYGKTININGNGHTLDGNKQGYKEIDFKPAMEGEGTGFGILDGSNVKIENLKFVDYTHRQRGTIYVRSSSAILNNIEMTGFAQKMEDGHIWGSMVAVVDASKDTVITNSIFKNIDLTLHVPEAGGEYDSDGGVLHIQGSQSGHAQSNVTLIENTKFLNNKLTVNRNIYGGAVYNEGIIDKISNVIFEGNEINATGALTESVMDTEEGKMLKTGGFGGAFSLGSHNDGRGVATIKLLENTTFKDNSVTSNEGFARGGALWSGDNSLIEVIKSCTFTGNKSISTAGKASGGAIYVNGNIGEIVGSTFTNNSVESPNDFADGIIEMTNLTGAGGAIFTKRNITIKDGTTFSGNSVKYVTKDADDKIINDKTIVVGNDIHLSVDTKKDGSSVPANLIITTSDINDKKKNFVNILSGIASRDDTSTITVQDGVTLNLEGVNQFFTGRTNIIGNSILNYTQTDRYLNPITKKYLDSFLGGTVNVEAGSVLNFENTYSNIDGTVTNLIGAGTFNKTGGGLVEVNKTIDNGVKFTGNFNLEEGALTVHAAPQSTKGQTDFTADIANGTTFTYDNGGYSPENGRDDSFTLDKNFRLKFDNENSNSTLNFRGHGTFTVNEDIKNAAGNNISISNATVSFVSHAYDANYNVKSSTITLQNDNAITNVIFNNSFTTEETRNYKIDFDFTEKGKVDTITANAGNATLTLIDVKALSPQNDKGQLAGKMQTYKALTGATFESSSSKTDFDSDVYRYTIASVKDTGNVTLIATALKDLTLYKLNHEKDGDRYFYFLGDTPYSVKQNLKETLAGTLYVNGKNDNPADSVITGENKFSFFQNDKDNSKLVIKNVTLQDAKGTNIAAVLDVNAKSTVSFENVVIKGNNTVGGKASAISNNGGTVTLKDVSFENNTGAASFIYNNGTMDIISTTIDRVLGNGTSDGKITNDGTMNLTTEGNDVVYAIASAIDNNGTMNITENSSIAISNNSGINATDGVASSGVVDVKGNILLKDNTSNIVINTDLQGNGNIIKSDDVVAEIKGEDNSQFKGNVNINGGTLKFVRTDSNKFFDKSTKITVDNATLDYTTNRVSGTLDNIFADITLQNRGKFEFSGRPDGTSQITLNDGIVKSDSSSNSLIFNNADYILNTAFDKPAGDSDNVVFNNATIRVRMDDQATERKDYDMGSSKFTLNNSAFRFLNSVAGDTYTFDSLTMNDSKMSLDVDLTLEKTPGGKRPKADTFTASGGEGGVVEIIRIYVTADNGIFDVVDGQQTKGPIQVFTDEANKLRVAKENKTQILSWATNIYKYGIRSASSDGVRVADSIEVTPKGVSTTGTLRDMNRYEIDNGGGNRGFSFIVQKDASGKSVRNDYNIYRDLDTTSEGTFSVLGTIDDELGKSILDGTLKEVVTTAHESADKLVENCEDTNNPGVVTSITYDGVKLYPGTDYDYDSQTGVYTIKTSAFSKDQKQGSMFEVVRNTDFLLKDLTVKNAKRYDSDTIKDGSVIYAKNSEAVINLENVDLTDNSADGGNGGAIANYQSKIFKIRDMKADNNTAGGLGGAIYTAADMAISDSDFGANGFNYHHTDVKNDIYIDGASTRLTYSVKENSSNSINSGIAGNGVFTKIGAGTLNLTGNNKDFTGLMYIGVGDVNFEQKSADDSFVTGKTFVNKSSGLTINNNFADMTAGVFEGSGTINKEGSKNMTLSGDNSMFTGDANIKEGKIIIDTDNAKYFSGSTNIDTAGSLDLTNNSSIELSKISGKGTLSKSGSGTLIMKGDNSGFNGNLYINDGTFALAADTTLGTISQGIFNDGTAINLQNTRAVQDKNGNWTTSPNPASLQNLNFDKINLNGNVGLNLDVDLKNTIADTIAAKTVTGDGHLILGSGSINLVSDSLLTNTKVRIASGALAKGDAIILSDDAKTVMGPIQKYDVTYSAGHLGFFRQGGTNPTINSVNPSVMASVVATQVGGHLTQLQTLQDGFFHMERYTKYASNMRLAAEMNNKNAITGTPAYRKSVLPETSQAMWVKPYTSFEKVHLRGGIGVSNVMYGALYGGDSDMVDLGHGYKGVVSAFVGYNGAHQAYNGVSMNQQGGTLGLTGTLYKGNFFTGLTVSTGASAGEAYTSYGTDHFAMMTAGAASKTGYNWEISEGKMIVQPSLFLGYTFANTYDYTNAAGVRIDSDPLNAIQIVPGLKVIGNLKNGWQPYAGLDMAWSIMGSTDVMANDVRLPQLSVKPYVQYGVGLQKGWGERFTGFFQTMIRNGGRSGIILTGGFRWTVGKKPEKTSPNKQNKPTVIKQLEQI